MELSKYFEKRPGADRLYRVGGMVFIDRGTAELQASRANGEVVEHLRGEAPVGATAEKARRATKNKTR
jgi:hypothetical protein